MTLIKRLALSALICLPTALLGAMVLFRLDASPFSVGLMVGTIALQFAITSLLLANKRTSDTKGPATSVSTEDEADEKLRELEEIGRLFGGSLGLRDIFRLLAVRASDLLPVVAARLEKTDGAMPGAEAVYGNFGPEAVPIADGLKDAAVAGGGVVTEEIRGGDGSATLAVFAVRRREEVLGVVSFLISGIVADGSDEFELLEAMRTRIEPAIAGAISRERSDSNSLSDPVSGLPNERAFDLVFENRLAEARRSRGEAELAVVAIDLAGFAEVNKHYGHSTGDRVLNYAGEVLKEQLREMDFLARPGSDEFLVVLSGAGPETSGGVISRLRENLSKKFFKLPDGRGFPINLNAGAAFFGPDGESSRELLSAARRRKDGSKPGKSNQVIQFPTKYSN